MHPQSHPGDGGLFSPFPGAARRSPTRLEGTGGRIPTEVENTSRVPLVETAPPPPSLRPAADRQLPGAGRTPVAITRANAFLACAAYRHIRPPRIEDVRPTLRALGRGPNVRRRPQRPPRHRMDSQQTLPLERAPMSLTLDELDSHLFKCADIIRNAVDKTDYKDFILPLVFYKTISDTYQYRFAEVMDEVGDEEIARQEAWYDFVVPEEHSWDALRQTGTNVDQAINEAFRLAGEEE
jgi:hypothetical protein